MTGEVPPMFRFVFWVGLSIGILGFLFFMTILIHRRNMKALEVLRFERDRASSGGGRDAHQADGRSGGCGSRTASSHKTAHFIALVITACIPGGIAWWRMNEEGPQWVVYLFACGAVFFGLRSELGRFDLARSQYEIAGKSASPAAIEANARLAALSHGGVAAEDIRKLRSSAGANCAMCHGK